MKTIGEENTDKAPRQTKILRKLMRHNTKDLVVGDLGAGFRLFVIFLFPQRGGGQKQ